MKKIIHSTVFITLSVLLASCANKQQTANSGDHTGFDSTLAYPSSIDSTTIRNSYICHNPERYKNHSLGRGECVDLVQYCSNAPLTKFWKKGQSVFGKDIPKGTAIATFKNNKYPNKSGYHAAIFSHQDEKGIYVWDQWRGKAVHLRFIAANQHRKKPGNNASKYRVIIN